MASNICAEQQKLEEDNDVLSKAGSLNADLLDESMEEDDTREPAVTRSAAKRMVDEDISAAIVVNNKSVPSAPALIPNTVSRFPQQLQLEARQQLSVLYLRRLRKGVCLSRYLIGLNKAVLLKLLIYSSGPLATPQTSWVGPEG